jgi:hypothetical protein
MALFPPLKGGGNGVAYGYKGKGILIHSITDANAMPLVAITTPEQWGRKAASFADASSNPASDGQKGQSETTGISQRK